MPLSQSRNLNNKQSKLKPNRVLAQKSLKANTNQIQVNLTSNVPAGRFCYDICLYDAQNNISQIQTVCVTVESWGGNASIVGEWVSAEAALDDDMTTITCNSGQTITVQYEQISSEEWVFVLNADGTYYETYDTVSAELNYDATASNCEATYYDAERSYEKFSGNWAYNEDNNTLTVIDFRYENLLDPTDNEDYDNGEIYFEGVKAEIISGQLVLTGDELDGTSGTLYFNRR